MPRPLRLTRLDPGSRYEITLINRHSASTLSRGNQRLKDEPITLSGAALMHQGLTLPWSFPDRMWVVEGKKAA